MKFQNISIHGSNLLLYVHESNKWPKIAKGHNLQNFIKLVENLIR